MSGLKVLVTGATGFLGGRLCDELVRRGFCVNALVRPSSNTATLQSLGVAIYSGDLRDIGSLKKGMAGMDVVIHAAADTSGDPSGGQLTTVMGTRNAIDAAVDNGVRQFVYVSSCSVYGIADCRPGQKIDESGPLEKYPEARGYYSNAKYEAEQFVLKAMNNNSTTNITCLRPGTIWGPGGEPFTPMIGFKIGKKIMIITGSGKFILPLVYLDNLVNAIVTCIDHPGAYNQVFNMVDMQAVDKKRYTNELLKPLFPEAFFFRLPYWALFAAVGFQEALCRLLGRKPFLTRYRLISSQRSVVYDAGKIERQLDWHSPVGFDEAVHEVLQFERTKVAH